MGCYVVFGVRLRLLVINISSSSPAINTAAYYQRCVMCRELYWLDMSINFKKSCCMCIGPRCDAVCANITSSTGSVIAWVSEIRYLGVYFSRFRRFNCSIDHAKRSFCKAANSVFGKIGRIASEEVTLQLVKSKCSPVLLYGLEVCELNKSQMASLDFTINRFL